jgi:hypothetical protein
MTIKSDDGLGDEPVIESQEQLETYVGLARTFEGDLQTVRRVCEPEVILCGK